MDNKKPVNRVKNVTGGSKGVERRGSGLGTGPVGNGRSGGGFSGGSHSGGYRPSGSSRPSGNMSGGSTGSRGGCGGGCLSVLVVFIIILIVVGKFFGGGSDDSTSGIDTSNVATTQTSNVTNNSDTSATAADLTVAQGARDKYTTIKGDGTDQVTLMVYMCGTDLESKSGMASRDLQEMASATLSDSVNLIVYTGGCKKWNINGISNQTTQIWQVKDGKLNSLESDMGNKSMTDPETLASFIKYATTNFPANRNQLILWDHGGGSVSGYGYDEKFSGSGSMNLSGIGYALNKAGVKFDFVGFDACLMGSLENGLMLSDYADYLVASEETEPGVGWYYTNWLTALSSDPGISTVELGKKIVDDFVTVCEKSASGQKTTLSVVDLAELSATVPDKLSAFSGNITEMIKEDQYQTVAQARGSSREFATSSKIDQVDLIDLANRIGTEESLELAEVLKSAVKYNRTSYQMTNSNGISIYFPYRKLSTLDNAVKTYEAIGMDSEYTRAIQEYASLEVAGQSAGAQTTSSQYSGNPYGSLSGSGSYSSPLGDEALNQLFGALFGSGSVSGISGLDGSNTQFLSGRAITSTQAASYVAGHSLDASTLTWAGNSEGQPVIPLTQEQWDLLTDIELNLFVDDGAGYIDLGMDNVYSVDEDDNLVAETDRTWLAIDGQPVAYYYMNSEQDGDRYSISGYVPAFLNGERVKLILQFDQDNPNGFIAGAQYDYQSGETDLLAKDLEAVKAGDQLDFLCDYYSYNGQYQDTYYLGETMTLSGTPQISNVSVGDKKVLLTYCLTDIYQQRYWTPVLKEK